jgi:hypothetical protein
MTTLLSGSGRQPLSVACRQAPVLPGPGWPAGPGSLGPGPIRGRGRAQVRHLDPGPGRSQPVVPGRVPLYGRGGAAQAAPLDRRRGAGGARAGTVAPGGGPWRQPPGRRLRVRARRAGRAAGQRWAPLDEAGRAGGRVTHPAPGGCGAGWVCRAAAIPGRGVRREEAAPWAPRRHGGRLLPPGGAAPPGRAQPGLGRTAPAPCRAGGRGAWVLPASQQPRLLAVTHGTSRCDDCHTGCLRHGAGAVLPRPGCAVSGTARARGLGDQQVDRVGEAARRQDGE